MSRVAIRNGEWSYEKLVEYVETEDKKLDDICRNSKFIPDKPDYKFLDELCMDIIQEMI